MEKKETILLAYLRSQQIVWLGQITKYWSVAYTHITHTYTRRLICTNLNLRLNLLDLQPTCQHRTQILLFLQVIFMFVV